MEKHNWAESKEHNRAETEEQRFERRAKNTDWGGERRTHNRAKSEERTTEAEDEEHNWAENDEELTTQRVKMTLRTAIRSSGKYFTYRHLWLDIRKCT